MKNRKLTIILIITIFFSVILFNYDKPINQERKSIEDLKTNNGTVKSPLICGFTQGGQPGVLDPVDSWDSATNDVIRQVCDNLWTYNLSDPNLPLEMRLAAESPTWDATKTNLTVILRENVWFYDGTLFNATAVKFTFDRIMYFINWSGDLPDTTHTANPASLFFDMKGEPILNRTVINSEYNVTFVLNKPNAIFIPLLTYEACAILHPASTPATTYLELGTDTLVGTGPFKFIHYIAGDELRFERFDLYWKGEADIEEIIFKYYSDSITAGNALLNGDCHFLKSPPTSMIATFDADPNLVFLNMETSVILRYFGLNNRKINNTNVRKAIAYAYNYTYYIEEIRFGYAIRAHQYLPPGFPYYNVSFRAPYCNTSIARQAMLDACAELGLDATGLTADAVGVNPANDAAWSAKTFFTYKILEHEGYTTGIMINTAFANDMDAIGISVVPDIMNYDTYIYVTTYDEDRLEIFHTGWGADYLDPFNMIEPLLNNMSSANHIQLQDVQIMQWLTEYEEELDTVVKGELLYKIQQRAINEIYAELLISNDMVMYAHHKNLTGFPYNLMNRLYFYPCSGNFSVPVPPPDDNYEENDYYYDAYDLSSNEATWLSSIDGLGIQADTDWYEIYIDPGNEFLQVALTFTDAEGDIDIDVYDASVSYITGSYSTTDNEYINTIVPTSGIYYLEIYGSSAGNEYDLWWDDTGAPTDDNYEENDDETEPYNLSLYEDTWLSSIDGLGIQADMDWYEIYVDPGDGHLMVTATFSHADGNIDLVVANPSMTWYVTSDSVTDDEHIDVIVPSSGTYYLIIIGENRGNAYDLWWDDFSSTDDNYEWNDAYTSAYDFSAHKNVWLSTVDGTGVQFDDDWYKISIDPGYEQLIVDLTFTHIADNLDLGIYDSTGTLVTESTSSTDDEHIDYVLPSSGTYYIRVNGSDIGNEYDLRWNSIIPDDNYEENDVYTSAYDLSGDEDTLLSTIDGFGVQLDDDWYEISIAEGYENVTIVLTFTQSAGNIELALYDSTGNLITSSATTTDNEYLNYVVSSSGTFFIKVYGDNAGNSYNLMWSSIEYTPPGGTPAIPGYDLLFLFGVIIAISILTIRKLIKRKPIIREKY